MTSTNKWCNQEAKKIVKEYKSLGINEDIALRTYSARLLGSDPELVLHGGGNTSVKTFSENLFGKKLPVLCVKGSGWDLATIEPEGHPRRSNERQSPQSSLHSPGHCTRSP